jgi:virginiamycin B lyase
MRTIINVFAVLLLLGAGSPGVAPAVADNTVDIKEWNVPWENTRPRDPFVDMKGRVWFVGQGGDYLAYLRPEDGTFKRYDLEPGTGPHSLVVDGEGKVWFAGNRAAYIGILDPSDGSITKVRMPVSGARDPHTLVIGPDGNIWFTVQGGNFIGRLEMKTREVSLIAVPTSRALPYGIVIGPKGEPWFAEFGSNKLGRIDPARMSIEEFPLPRINARPRRIAAPGDGALWYVDYRRGYLGRLEPDSRSVKEWAMPEGRYARPYGMAVDSRGRLWFVETGPSPNRLVGFDSSSGKFISATNIPSGGGSVRNMFYHRPDNTLWFGTDTNTIGRARLPE